MKTLWWVALVVSVSVVALGGDWPMGLPSADAVAENAVADEVLDRVALSKAVGTWGECDLLVKLPCCDLNGRLVAYMYVFQYGEGERLGYAEIIERAREGRSELIQADAALKRAERELDGLLAAAEAAPGFEPLNVDGSIKPVGVPMTEDYGAALDAWKAARRKKCGTGEFGTLIVSARRDQPPVPVTMHGLPNYLARGDLIHAKAKARLGADCSLKKIYMGGPLDQWYRFENQEGESVLVDPFRLQSHNASEISALMPATNRLRVVTGDVAVKWQQWENALVKMATVPPRALAGSDVFVDYNNEEIDGSFTRKLIPYVLWSCGCSPTAGAMCLGYWDNYGPIGGGSVGKYSQWGRLIDYYIDETTCESYSGSDGVNFSWNHEGENMARPMLMVDLAWAFDTTGAGGGTDPTDISPGINEVCNDKGYGSSWSSYHTGLVWTRIKNQIDDNHTAHVAIDGHSICVWGYDDTNDEGILYDTWHEYRVDWDKDQFIRIRTVEPQNGNGGNDINMTAPDGGETWSAGSSHSISWYQWGTTIDNCRFYYSTDGGGNWTYIGQDSSVSAGYNSWSWSISPSVSASQRMRVKIIARDGTSIEGEDGSQENFTMNLGAPTGVAAADGTSTTQIHVQWNSVSGATHYRVYRNTYNSSASATAISSWQTQTSYNDSPGPGDRYYYFVKAAKSSGGSMASDFSSGDDGFQGPTTIGSDSAQTLSDATGYYGIYCSAGTWLAAGVRPDTPGENWSVRVYSDLAFESQEVSSTTYETVDFIVIDGNHAGGASHGFKPYRVSGAGTATVEMEQFTETLSSGTNTTQSWPAGDVVEIYEVTLPAATYRFTLEAISGSVDLDFGLFSSQGGDYQQGRNQAVTVADDATGGSDETFIYTVSASDDYGLCLWANDANSGSYRIIITELEAGIWEGDESANWYTGANWSDGNVPDSTVDVTIPSGTPYSPVISSGTASCRDITVQAGAQVTVGAATLNVNDDLNVYGHLVMSANSSRIEVTDDVYWRSGSTESIQGSSAVIVVWSSFFVYDGADFSPNMGFVEFQGSGWGGVYLFDPDARFYRVRNYKGSGGYLSVYQGNTAPMHVANFYNYSGSKLIYDSGEPFIVDNFFNNMDGHYEFNDGAIVYEGNVGAVPLKPNADDYLNDLVMSGSSAMTVSNLYSSAFTVNGDVTIESGALELGAVTMYVGGDWSNAVGNAGFNANDSFVFFSNTNGSQHVYGETTFYNVSDLHRGTVGGLYYHGPTRANRYYARHPVHVYDTFEVGSTLYLSYADSDFFVHGGGAVDISSFSMGSSGRLTQYGGTVTADDLVNDGLYGFIELQAGQMDLHQGTGAVEYVDLNGELVISGGIMNVHGGARDSHWSASGDAAVTMSGKAVLDFQSQGIVVTNTAHSFTERISGGAIKTVGGFRCDRPSYSPTGGRLHLYGPLSSSVRMVSAANLHDLYVEKMGRLIPTVRADSNLTLNGDFQLQTGKFLASPVMYVGEHWINNVGPSSFDPRGGEVRFVGAKRSYVFQDETFHNVRVDKTYFGNRAWEVASGKEVGFGGHLDIRDGCVELNNSTVLDVAGDLMIAFDAGLNANDFAPVVYVGGDWSNANTNHSISNGFDQGSSSLVVFDGVAAQSLTTAAAQEDFFDLVVSCGGKLTLADGIQVFGDAIVSNGLLVASTAGLTHTFHGDLKMVAAGEWGDDAGTVRFEGTGTQHFEDQNAGLFGNVVVEKSPGTTLFVESDIAGASARDLTIDRGGLDLNGHAWRCLGNATVNSNGVLSVDQNAKLRMGAGSSIQINADGRLEVLGVSGQPAAVTRNGGSGHYMLRVNAGGILAGRYGVFEFMDADGVHVTSLGVVDHSNPLDACTFRYGEDGGVLLRVENDQTLTITDAVFPVVGGGVGPSNVSKTMDQGVVTFANYSGAFSGEFYEWDPHGRVHWGGNISGIALSGPPVGTRSDTYTFTARVFPETCAKPVAYLWAATDQSGAVHTLSSTTDTCDYSWLSTGAKTISVTASNVTGAVSSNCVIDVQDLMLVDISHDGSAVTLQFAGTSTQSMYEVSFRTNMLSGDWETCTSNCYGGAGATTWTDAGGPGHDPSTMPSLYYRVQLQSTP